MNDDVIVTIFRSRLRPDADAYGEVAARMEEEARAMPGFLEVKGYTAEDGERVTIVAFDSMAAHEAWRDHADHREAQRRGRSEFYAWYRLQVCRQLRERTFIAP